MKKKIKATTGKKIPLAKERDKKGRYAKGHKGGPGRKPGEPRDIICKDGKKRSAATLIDDLLAAYETLGGPKFLKSWAAHSHRNLARFIEILFKFAPMPTVEDDRKFTPLTVQITKVLSDKRPEEMGKLETYSQSHQALQDQINELQKQVREKNNELERFKGIFASHDIDPSELEHTPLRDELPGHDDETEDEEDHSDRRYK